MRFNQAVLPVLLCLWVGGLAVLAASPAKSPAPGHPIEFVSGVKPLFTKYCLECHGAKMKGGVDLRNYADEASAKADPETFADVLDYVKTGDMPPEGRPQPTAAERKRIVDWIQAAILGCDCDHPDPGRVTLHRLNRTEYNNTIRDLLGVRFQPADDFPADDIGYGFDNIGDVLSLSPLLMEKYLAAAAKVMDLAIPADAGTNSPSESRKRIFVREPGPESTNAAAREIITNFAGRAWRRPVTPAETDRLIQLFQMVQKDGGGFDAGIKLALQAVLVSPNFLFRGELQPEPDNPKSIHPIDEYALASRLSYFLWSSLPDGELSALAAKGKLRQNLEPQVRRMLRDPKAHALVENFGDQWLQIRGLATAAPDPAVFPAFSEDLRADMTRETEMYVEYVMRQDRSVLEFIDSDYTFLNDRLARHYGINGVTGAEFRRVTLHGRQRGGVLTQASVLTVTSTPTRTSPVKRGKWVLENLLGTPPPPPLPDVPQLPEGKAVALTGTLRQRMEQHRADPACANCHAKMDPIGFGLENFDGIGAWRTNENGFTLDTTGRLTTGESFKNVADLKTILLKRKGDQFVQCLSEKMLTYALGRGLERYDQCAVEGIAAAVKANRDRFSSLVMAVVNSVPFQMRRGEEQKIESAAPKSAPGN